MVFGPAALLVSTSVGVSKRGFLHSQSLNPVTKSPKQCKVFSNFFTRLPMSSTLNKTILGLVPFSVARERTEASESLPLAAVSWIKSSQSASVTFRNNLTIHYGACAPCAQKDCCCFLMMLYYTLSYDDGPFRGEETKFGNNMDVTKSRKKIDGKRRIPHVCHLLIFLLDQVPPTLFWPRSATCSSILVESLQCLFCSVLDRNHKVLTWNTCAKKSINLLNSFSFCQMLTCQ